MLKSEPNIYQTARLDSRVTYTQEAAAERLHVSVATVKAWEQGARVPDARIVFAMSELYDAPWLCLAHAQTMLRDLGIFPERVQLRGLPTAVLSLDDSIREMLDDYRRLIHIAADGQIDETESADFDEIKATILQMVVAGLQVIYYYDQGTKKDRLDAGTSKRSPKGHLEERYVDYRKAIIAQPELLCNPKISREGGASR